jgi:ATP/maltotriose-dependent transcriptional regulator MalT
LTDNPRIIPARPSPSEQDWGSFREADLASQSVKRLATMLRTILIYGALLALGAIGLEWLQYQYLIRTFPNEAWLALLAIVFMGLGIWVGARIFHKTPPAPFEPNIKVRETLGISDRELEVLELLAAGRSNKEIATRLDVSPNTVKTHVAKLFEKLEVRRRTEAILKARELGMIR